MGTLQKEDYCRLLQTVRNPFAVQAEALAGATAKQAEP